MTHTSGVKTRARPRRGRRRSDDPQIVRALALLVAMTRSSRSVLLKQFAEQRGYPLRAVYRDRDALRRAGVHEEIGHPLFGYRVSYRWILEVQIRLLARYLAGDIDEYPPFATR